MLKVPLWSDRHTTLKNIYNPLKMNFEVHYQDLGLIDYKKAWDYQEELFTKVAQEHQQNKNTPHYLLFCEHPHVYTLGQHGQANNLLIREDYLKKIGATFYHINRGGDITYHGPGQIVGYPIFHLYSINEGIKSYIEKLEESIIQLLEQYDIKAARMQGATGVWLDTGLPSARKICAIGVRVGHGVTMHGFAFNINTNLDYFRHINPCGFIDKGVTTLSKELGKPIDFEEVKNRLKEVMRQVFGFSWK